MLGERWSLNDKGEILYCIGPEHFTRKMFTEKFSDKIIGLHSILEDGKSQLKTR